MITKLSSKLLVVSALFANLICGCRGSRPDDLGVKDGQLRPCPGHLNCVESRDGADAEHKIAAFAAGPDAEATFKRLALALAATERASVVTSNETYIHTEFTSKYFSFVDDAEFLLDKSTNTIQVRSAARLGRRDFGVNKEHIEALRAHLTAEAASQAAPGH